MDTTDLKILNVLQQDARAPYKEIAERVSLSAPAVKERVSKMVASRLIREFTTVLEPEMLGKSLTAFMFLTLRRADIGEKFLRTIEKEKDVLSCYYLTGDFDYMIQIVTESSHHLEQVLTRLKGTHEVARTRTVIALSTIKEKHSVSP